MSLLILVGGGIGLGALIDYVIQGRQVIFESGGAVRDLTVAPLLAVDRYGMAVSFGF